MTQKPATRQLILEAVAVCIEKYGLENVTTRRIALEAGTNLASINYHFRSKDELVAEALSMTINHMLQDVFVTMDDHEKSFEATLTDVIFYLLDGSLRFPGISRAHLSRAISDPNRNTVSAQAINKLFEKLVERAAQAYPRKNRADLRLRVSQVLSSIMFNMLTPGIFTVAPQYRPTSSRRAMGLAKSYAKLFLGAI